MFDDGKMWFRVGKRRILGLMGVLGDWEGKMGFGDLGLRKICVLRMMKKHVLGNGKNMVLESGKRRKIWVLVFMRFWGIMMEKWFLWI